MRINASRSALMVSAWEVCIPCGSDNNFQLAVDSSLSWRMAAILRGTTCCDLPASPAPAKRFDLGFRLVGLETP